MESRQGLGDGMERQEYIDVLRGISIIGVIAIHVISVLGGVEACGSHIVYLGITRYCVVMFFLCTGAILLRKDRKLNIRKLYTKNIPRFFAAIFLYGLLHKVVRFFLGQYGDMTFGRLLLSYPKKFITGELEFSFWYMYALIPIYFMLPVLKAIVMPDHDRKVVKIFLILWGMASLINGLSHLMPLSFLNTWTNGNWNFCTVYGYPGYVVLGAYLGERNYTKRQRWGIYVLGGLACIVAILDQLVRVEKGYSLEYTLFDYYSPTTIVLAIAVFVGVRHLGMKRKAEKNYDKILTFAGRYSMGMYFLHTVVLLILQERLLKYYTNVRPVRSLVYIALIFLLTLGIVWGLASNKYSRKWI